MEERDITSVFFFEQFVFINKNYKQR